MSSALLELVAVMDRLRSPGGCPWDAEQTHASLLTYLLEEAYETVEAVESGDRAHLREELGDLLLQVMFHARIATEHPTDPFGIDEVAAGIVAKLVRRHPHVFATDAPGGEAATTASDLTERGTSEGDKRAISVAQVEANWDSLKAAEKGRASAMDGVPLAQPALALADTLLSRSGRAGITAPTPPAAPLAAEADLGEALFALVVAARERGLDPEAELRSSCRRYAAAVRAAEPAAPQRPG